MLDEVINGLVQGASACIGWFTQFFETLGVGSVFIGAFTIYCIYRMLLKPLLGGGVGRSDSVKKKHNHSSNEAGKGDDEIG